jgi:hypothetical protein
MPEMFTAVAAGWYSDETDKLEFDDDDTANAEYIATNDNQPSDDEPYYPDEVGI